MSSTISGDIPVWTNWASPPVRALTPRAAYRAPTSSRAASTMWCSRTGSARSPVTIWLARSKPRSRPWVAITSWVRSTSWASS